MREVERERQGDDERIRRRWNVTSVSGQKKIKRLFFFSSATAFFDPLLTLSARVLRRRRHALRVAYRKYRRRSVFFWEGIIWNFEFHQTELNRNCLAQPIIKQAVIS